MKNQLLGLPELNFRLIKRPYGQGMLCVGAIYFLLEAIGVCDSAQDFSWPPPQELEMSINDAQDPGLPKWRVSESSKGYEISRLYDHECASGKKTIGRRIYIQFDEVRGFQIATNEGLASLTFIFDDVTSANLSRFSMKIRGDFSNKMEESQLQKELDSVRLRMREL